MHLGIYWHNHHHLLHACHRVDGRVLWANTHALGYDVKGKIAVVIYLVAIPLALVSAWIGGLLYVAVAVMWLLPDRRIEDVLVRGA